jgi:hypothetical protein
MRIRTTVFVGLGLLAAWVLISLASRVVTGRAAIGLAVLPAEAEGDSFGAAIVRIGDLTADGCDEFVVAAQPMLGVGGGYASVRDGRSLKQLARLPGDGSQMSIAAAFCAGLRRSHPAELLGLLGRTQFIVYDGAGILAGQPGRASLAWAELAQGFSWIGDVDGDGTSDIALLSRAGNTPGGDRLSLVSSTTGEELRMLHDMDDRASETSCVATIGDLDFDGLPEFCESNAGIVTVYSGTGNVVSGRLDGGNSFGDCVQPCGDWDSDGVPDFAVGAPREKMGRVVVVSGTSLKFLRDIQGREAWDGFGASIACLDGQLDASGPALLILATNGRAERLTVVSRDGGRHAWAVGPRGEPAWSMAALGDVDGDGRSDVAVGFPALRPFTEPRVAGSADVVSLAGDEFWWALY